MVYKHCITITPRADTKAPVTLTLGQPILFTCKNVPGHHFGPNTVCRVLRQLSCLKTCPGTCLILLQLLGWNDVPGIALQTLLRHIIRHTMFSLEVLSLLWGD